MSKACKEYFEALNMPYDYKIDKQQLKENYFANVKNKNKSSEFLNKAYNTLKDDFQRAKCMNTNDIYKNKDFGETITENNIQLDEFLSMQEEIMENTNNLQILNRIKQKIEKEIEICKDNYKDVKYLNKWSYLNKLMDILNKCV